MKQGHIELPTPERIEIPELFEEMVEKEEERKKLEAEKAAANDNKEEEVQLPRSVAPVLEHLADALSSFTTEERVLALVRKEMSEAKYSYLVKLQKPDGSVTELPDQKRHYLFKDVLETVNINLPVALIGPAGAGKSTMVTQVSDALGLKFFLQNGVTGTHEFTGYMDAYGRYVSTPFRSVFEEGGLFMVDEADASDAAALKWLNTALANGYAAFPDKSEPVTRHRDFRIVIAANTYGTGADRLYVGANQLDASTLDRFVFFTFKYDEKLELALAGNPEWAERVQKIRAAADKEKARMVISPRASINGAKLLSLGWFQTDVENATIWKGTDPELKKRILDAANLNEDAETQQANIGFLSGMKKKKFKKAA